jgi:hypothetical protein
MDGRLKTLNQAYNEKKMDLIKKESNENSSNSPKNYELDTFYISFAEHNTLPRYRLPCVPTVIKVGDNAKLREQTET